MDGDPGDTAEFSGDEADQEQDAEDLEGLLRLEPGELGSNNLLYACILPLRMWRPRPRDPATWRRINFLQVQTF